MTSFSTKINRLTAKQRRVYEWMLKQQNLNGLADREAIYRRVIFMPEAEIDTTLNAIYEENTTMESDDVLRKIKARYTDDQLRQLADGVGVEKTVKLKLGTSEHHKIGVISDTHIGSIYSPDNWMPDAIKKIQEEGCECILHCGDLTEGIKGARLKDQMLEIKDGALGYRKMRDRAIAEFSDLSIPMYIISGNHDKFFDYDADIVEDVAEKVSNLVYLGNDLAFLEIGGVKIAMYHGHDGYSSVRLTKIAEKSVHIVKNNVKMLFAGHVHKYETKFVDDCWCIHVPCLQQQSSFMRGKSLVAECGFLIIEFDAVDGKLTNVKQQYFIM